MSTWRDIEEAAYQTDASGFPLFSPARVLFHGAVTLERRGDLTREEALCGLALALLQSCERMFAQLVEARAKQMPAPILIMRDGEQIGHPLPAYVPWHPDRESAPTIEEGQIVRHPTVPPADPLPGRTGQSIETHGWSAPHTVRDLCVGLGEDGLE